jgi:hypothetical protein
MLGANPSLAYKFYIENEKKICEIYIKIRKRE